MRSLSLSFPRGKTQGIIIPAFQVCLLVNKEIKCKGPRRQLVLSKWFIVIFFRKSFLLQPECSRPHLCCGPASSLLCLSGALGSHSPVLCFLAVLQVHFVRGGHTGEALGAQHGDSEDSLSTGG